MMSHRLGAAGTLRNCVSHVNRNVLISFVFIHHTTPGAPRLQATSDNGTSRGQTNGQTVIPRVVYCSSCDWQGALIMQMEKLHCEMRITPFDIGNVPLVLDRIKVNRI